MENRGGFMLIMENPQNNIVRYNISENDQGHILKLLCSAGMGNVFYNNVIFNNHWHATLDPGHCTFINNIICAGAGGALDFTPKGAPGVFSHNCFWGKWNKPLPTGDGNIQADPKFKDETHRPPGPGDIAAIRQSLEAYRLLPDSPCLQAGVHVPDPGASSFFGTALPTDPNWKPNIGAE